MAKIINFLDLAINSFNFDNPQRTRVTFNTHFPICTLFKKSITHSIYIKKKFLPIFKRFSLHLSPYPCHHRSQCVQSLE